MEQAYNQHLLEKEKEKNQKEYGTDTKPLFVWIFLFASVVGMVCSYISLAKRFSFLFPGGITAKEIVKFMFQHIEPTNAFAIGPMWRIFLFYLYFISTAIIGLLNCIPSVNMALSRKPSHFNSRNVRNVILGTFQWILVIVWLLTIIFIDLHGVKFTANPYFYIYKITSYWLNLTWTLAIAFCTRNTIFQHIYRETYAVLIATHRIFGTFSFWMTLVHMLSAFGNWHTQHKEDFWKFLGHKIIHYAWEDYSWKDVHFLNLGFMISTDWLMKIMPIIFFTFLVAIPWVRRNHWEIFYYLHVVVLITFIYLMVFHSSNIIFYAYIPIVLYILDKLTRWYTIYTHPCTAVIQAYEGTVFMDVTVGSCFKSKYADLVGAVAYINVPKASHFEYHPMSIAYNEGNHFYFYIRVTGKSNSWTNRLAKLSGAKDMKVYIEGPYTMTFRKTDLSVIKKEEVLKKEYKKNIVIVGGGCGFAGVSSYLKDAMRLVRSLPAEKQMEYHIYVVLVVTYHAHIDCMKELLIEAKRCPFVEVHLYSTYSQNEQLKITSPKGKNANKLEVMSDAEEKELLEFTVARPNMEEIIATLNNEAISAFYCGPKALENAFFDALSKQKRPFYYVPEVFDM